MTPGQRAAAEAFRIMDEAELDALLPLFCELLEEWITRGYVEALHAPEAMEDEE